MTPSKEPDAKALKASLQAIEQHLAKQAPESSATVQHIEKRLQALTEEVDNSSHKMVAYKLKRLAESKMVSEASQKMTTPVQYQSSTFQCKSDLDQCLVGSQSALQKALCYALFIRCAFKG